VRNSDRRLAPIKSNPTFGLVEFGSSAHQNASPKPDASPRFTPLHDSSRREKRSLAAPCCPADVDTVFQPSIEEHLLAADIMRKVAAQIGRGKARERRTAGRVIHD
jgi:hypothetical protein